MSGLITFENEVFFSVVPRDEVRRVSLDVDEREIILNIRTIHTEHKLIVARKRRSDSRMSDEMIRELRAVGLRMLADLRLRDTADTDVTWASPGPEWVWTRTEGR